jgi:tyrosinase
MPMLSLPIPVGKAGARMLHRRAFLAGGTALAMVGGGAKTQDAVVIRRSIRHMAAGDPDLAALRRAVAAMRALPRSDPRNWQRFADLHRAHCPHGNWYFLPWHRAYLVAFERLCRALSGKPDFALPYWDWTLERRLPSAFAAGNARSNPLYRPRPGLSGGLGLPEDMVGRAVLSRIMASPDFEAFGSTRPLGQRDLDPRWQREPGARTELEFNPHDGVHIAIGGEMADIDLAARDPLFFLHHANIDRLWTEWNRRGNANSSDPLWRDFSFSDNFIHPDGSFWDVTVGELGATPALGYRYDDDDAPFAADIALPRGDALDERLRAYRQFGSDVLSCSRESRGAIPLRAGAVLHVAAAENRQTASRERPIEISVPLDRPLAELVRAAAAAARRYGRSGTGRHERRHVWAIIRDIDPPADVTTRVHVFCNCEVLSPRVRLDHPNYATSLSFFSGRHRSQSLLQPHARTGHAMGACVDLTPVLGRMSARQAMRMDRITLQLVPVCAAADARASAVRPRCVEIVVI